MSYLEPGYAAGYANWQKTPSPENTAEMLKALKPEIDRGVLAHAGGDQSPTLRSYAKRLTLRALQTYDPRYASLGTHVVNHLRGLRKYSRKQQSILSVPEAVLLGQQRVGEAASILQDNLGREPTAAELADYTGISAKRLARIRQLRPAIAEGTISSLVERDEASLPATRIRQLPTAWPELVYQDLDPVNQKIMEWTSGMHGEPALLNAEIAKRLKLSPGAISQRRAVIQKKLDEEPDFQLL